LLERDLWMARAIWGCHAMRDIASGELPGSRNGTEESARTETPASGTDQKASAH
jgi:hypothetical protein